MPDTEKNNNNTTTISSQQNGSNPMRLEITISKEEDNLYYGKIKDSGIILVSPSLEEISQRFYRIDHKFNQWRFGEHISPDSPIIVGGAGRSGTTMLWKILDAHPEIACGLETNFFGRLPYILQFFNLPGRYHSSEAFVNLIYNTNGVDKATVQHHLSRSNSLAHFVELFYRDIARKRNKPRWGEKTPQNILYIDYLAKHFPKMKFIHIIRDGRDVICSANTDGSQPWETCLQKWLDPINIGFQHRGQPYYKEVRYEDFINNPHETFTDLCHFMDVEPNTEILDHFYERKHQYLLTSPKHDNSNNPINTKAQARWKKDLPDEAKEIVKEKAGDLLIRLGYETSNDW